MTILSAILLACLSGLVFFLVGFGLGVKRQREHDAHILAKVMELYRQVDLDNSPHTKNTTRH